MMPPSPPIPPEKVRTHDDRHGPGGGAGSCALLVSGVGTDHHAGAIVVFVRSRRTRASRWGKIPTTAGRRRIFLFSLSVGLFDHTLRSPRSSRNG